MRLTLLASMLLPALALAEGDTSYAKLDALYAKRDDAETVKELEAELAAAQQANPDDFEVILRVARWKHWIADGSKNPEQKKRLGKEVWTLGERLVKMAPTSVEGHYYAALGIGAYSQAVGILAALAEGLEGKFNERLDKAIKLAPGYEHAGPLVAKGRYFYELPWPLRNLQKSAEFYQKAIEQAPVALRAYHYLAETQLADGKPKPALEMVTKALEGSVDYDPPEGRRVQEWAKKLEADVKKRIR